MLSLCPETDLMCPPTAERGDHRSRDVERFVLRRGLSVDDHNSPGLLMGDDGRLTVYYTAPHRARMHYRRMTGAEDVTRWESERTLPAKTPGDKGYTYPNPLHLRAERRTYLFWRGGEWWPAFSRRVAGGRWTAARTLLRIPGQRPYLKLHGDGERSIHIAYTEGNPGSFVNSLYYLRLADDALHRADGTRVAGLRDLPLAPSRGDRVYDARPSGVRAWVWDVAVRRDGRPAIVYILLADGEDPVYMYAHWDGASWQRHRIAGAGWQLGNYAPGISLDHADPSAICLSRKVDELCVVEHWRTADDGATWRHSRVDTGSPGGDALRPILPRGRPSERDVLWMQGRYLGFTDYRTDVRAHLSRS